MKTFLQLLLRLFLSAFFFLAAWQQIDKAEQFELFVYAGTFFIYHWATAFARLIIAAEILVALGLLFRLKPQFCRWLAAVLSSGYILGTAAGMANIINDCHCTNFDWLNPWIHLGLYVLSLLFLVLIGNLRRQQGKYSHILFWTFSAGALAMAVILSPPDFLIKNRFEKATYDQSTFEEVLKQDQIPAEFGQGKKILSFYSTSCSYCKLQATRLAILFDKTAIDHDDARIVFVGDKPEKAADFFILTQSPPIVFDTLAVEPFLKLVNGRMPLVLLVENGRVEHAMTYRTFDESAVKDFFDTESD